LKHPRKENQQTTHPERRRGKREKKAKVNEMDPPLVPDHDDQGQEKKKGDTKREKESEKPPHDRKVRARELHAPIAQWGGKDRSDMIKHNCAFFYTPRIGGGGGRKAGAERKIQNPKHRLEGKT